MTLEILEQYIIVNGLCCPITSDGFVALRVVDIGFYSTIKKAKEVITNHNLQGCTIYKVTKIEAEKVEDGHRARKRKLGNNVSR